MKLNMAKTLARVHTHTHTIHLMKNKKYNKLINRENNNKSL